MNPSHSKIHEQAFEPPGWFLLGHLPELAWNILLNRGNFIYAVQKMFLKYQKRTLLLRLGPRRIVLTVDPAVAHEVLVDSPSDYPKADWEKRVFGPAMEGGLIILSGAEWKRHRHALASCFGSERMSGLADVTRDSLAVRMLGWEDEIDVSHEMRCVVNDVMFRFFMDGYRLGVDGSPDVDAVAAAFATVERGLEHRVFPLAPTWMQFGFLASLKRVSQIVKRLIQEPHRCPVDHDSPVGMLRKKLPSDEAVWKEIRTTMGAGATTGHLLSWLFQMLAEHPSAQERLRDEILAHGETPSLAAIESMPYLTAVIQEGLRLYPPAPFLIRQSQDRKRDLIFVSVWAMHRHPESWDNPEDFKPERWLENPTPAAFLPFGLGPRVCVGKRFAWVEARVLIFEVLQRYELCCGLGERPEPIFTVLTRPSRNIRVSLYSLDRLHKSSELKRFII